MPKASLVSEKSTLPAKTDDTSYLPSYTPDNAELVPTGVTGAPYVSFISSKSKTWAGACAAIPGLNETDPVLFRGPVEPPIKLAPFQVHLWKWKQFWGEMDDAGQVIRATFEKPEGDSDLKEIIETILLIHTQVGVVPARCTFKVGTCPALHTMVDGIRKASSPEWGKLGKDYEATLQVPTAPLRFLATITPGKKISKRSGRGYAVASARIAPVTEKQYHAVLDYFKDTANRGAFASVQSSFDNRVAEITELTE